jgi:hypothetical protein
MSSSDSKDTQETKMHVKMMTDGRQFLKSSNQCTPDNLKKKIEHERVSINLEGEKYFATPAAMMLACSTPTLT